MGFDQRGSSGEALNERVALLAKELTSMAPSTMSLGLAAYVAQDAMEFDEALPYLREQLDACLQSDDAKRELRHFLKTATGVGLKVRSAKS